MKQLSVRAIIALVTFSIGIAAVSIWFIGRHQPVTPKVEIVTVNSKTVPPRFLEMFSDFEYVCDSALSKTVPPHNTDIQSMPQSFEVKHQYIFHRQNPTDNDSLFAELQNRLRSKEIKILKANDIGYAYSGGLRFHIYFQDGIYRGHIENRIDHQITSTQDASLRKRLFIDDYILTIEEIKEMP